MVLKLYFLNEGTSENFKGKIDQVTIWDRCLSQFEIDEIISCEPVGSENGLISYWNFNSSLDHINGSLNDISGDNNMSTLPHGLAYYLECPGECSDPNHPYNQPIEFSDDVADQFCQLTTIDGCDSVAILNLTITQPDTLYTEITACESFEWNRRSLY